MPIKYSGSFIAILLSIFLQKAASTKDGYFLTLEHSFGDGHFYKRAEIYFQSLRDEEAILQEQSPLATHEYKELEELSKHDGTYRVRVQSRLQDFSSKNEDMDVLWLVSYTYADHVLKAKLCEDLKIHSDGLGNIIAINLSPSSCESLLDEEAIEFRTNVTLVMPSTAPVPDTHGYLNKLEDERRRKEKSDKEPSSFLGKYWMYILPVVFFMMMQNAMTQQQGQR